MLTVLFLMIILLLSLVAAVIKVDKEAKESVGDLEIAVDNLSKQVQNLKIGYEFYDREQEHI